MASCLKQNTTQKTFIGYAEICLFFRLSYLVGRPSTKKQDLLEILNVSS